MQIFNEHDNRFVFFSLLTLLLHREEKEEDNNWVCKKAERGYVLEADCTTVVNRFFGN